MNQERSSYSAGFRGTFDNEVPPSYGKSENNPLMQTSSFHTTFACVSLHMTDRIRLIRFPEGDVPRIQGIIRSSWQRGIQDLRVYDQSNEIKLNGNPWSAYGSTRKSEARRLVIGLLQGLFDMGWVLKAAVDVSKKEFDKGNVVTRHRKRKTDKVPDSLLFRYQQPAPLPCMWLCISFDKGDMIHVINAPTELNRSFVQALGPKVQRHEDQGSVFEIKFSGYPWRASGTETVQTRVILLILLETLEKHGFSLYGSVDQDNGPGGDSHSTEADTWFCNRQADWMPGAPLYHS